MTSYKEKLETLRRRIDIMEQRILLDESSIIGLQELIRTLSEKVEILSKPDDSTTLVIDQIGKSLSEILRNFGLDRNIDGNLISKDYKEVLISINKSLQMVSRSLRDSEVRGATVTRSLDEMMRKSARVSPPSGHHERSRSKHRQEETSHRKDGQHHTDHGASGHRNPLSPARK